MEWLTGRNVVVGGLAVAIATLGLLAGSARSATNRAPEAPPAPTIHVKAVVRSPLTRSTPPSGPENMSREQVWVPVFHACLDRAGFGVPRDLHGEPLARYLENSPHPSAEVSNACLRQGLIEAGFPREIGPPEPTATPTAQGS